jgi:glycosyltransferase involved in cell wall biosynthesis
MRRRVLVFNHFAVPLGEPGGTRHTELFSRVAGFSYLIVAARENLLTHRPQPDQAGFHFVPTTPYSSNGISRVLNWASYAFFAAGRAALDRRFKPDVVYASTPHLLAGLAGWLVSKRYGVPLILEIRDLWPKVLADMGQISEDSMVYKGLARLEKFLYRKADRIVVLAEGTAKQLVARGIHASRLHVISNGADPSYFDVQESREVLRADYAFDRLTFLYAGAHGPANGLDFLLDAAAGVRDLDVEFVLLGDGVAKPDLQRQAAQRGLTNVRFLDSVSKSDMPRVLAAADVGVHCLADVPLFKYGVSPNKMYDYMAAGKPVLTNTDGDVGQLVADARSGVAVRPDELSLGVRRIASASTKQLVDWGSNGREFMLASKSRQALADTLCCVLLAVTESRAP